MLALETHTPPHQHSCGEGVHSPLPPPLSETEDPLSPALLLGLSRSRTAFIPIGDCVLAAHSSPRKNIPAYMLCEQFIAREILAENDL